MKVRTALIVTMAALSAIGAQAKDLPLNGKDYINHDYNCIGVSTGRTASMTVQELPGMANTTIVAENTPKPIVVSLAAMDDQVRAARQYQIKSPNGAEEVLEVSSITKMATITMLHAAGLEVFTSMVCHEKD